jgi:hypothetical protein
MKEGRKEGRKKERKEGRGTIDGRMFRRDGQAEKRDHCLRQSHHRMLRGHVRTTHKSRSPPCGTMVIKFRMTARPSLKENHVENDFRHQKASVNVTTRFSVLSGHIECDLLLIFKKQPYECNIQSRLLVSD